MPFSKYEHVEVLYLNFGNLWQPKRVRNFEKKFQEMSKSFRLLSGGKRSFEFSMLEFDEISESLEELLRLQKRYFIE